MNLVDSSAWLEYLADGPHADLFAAVDVHFEGLPDVRFFSKAG